MDVTYWTVSSILMLVLIAAVAAQQRWAVERSRVAAEHAHRIAAEQAHRATFERALADLALTCRRCHALAPPILGTGNRYKCEQCPN